MTDIAAIDTTTVESIAARERVKAKAMASLVKRGKVPADLAAEYVVLDLAPLVPAGNLLEVAVWLQAAAFTSPGRSTLWRGCVAEAEAGREFDLFSAAGVDDAARAEAVKILALSTYAMPMSFERHARSVAEWHAFRVAAAELHDAQDVTGCTPAEALAKLAAVHVTMPATNAEAAAQAVVNAHALAEDAMRRYLTPDDATRHVSTTLPELDRILGGGFKADRPTVVGASTGIGKTAFAIQVACAAARTMPVYVVNAESTRDAWHSRAIAHLGRLPLHDVLNRQCDDLLDFYDTVDTLAKLNLYLDDGRINDGRANLEVSAMTERILTQHKRTPLGLVVIDYITKLTIREKFDRPDLRIGAISDRLAALCKQLGCPMLVLSQLNDLEPGRPPNRQNVAESRKVAHDAGAVLLLWSPDPNRIENVEIIVDKAGLAARGKVPALFLGSVQRFDPRAADLWRSDDPSTGRNRRGR